MFQRILVPLDESSRAERAIPIAARIARASGGSVVLLQVAGIPTKYWPSMYSSYVSQSPFFAQELLDADLTKAQYYLTTIAQSKHLADIKTETKALSGAAASAILEMAGGDGELHIDLIVMCSRGETGLKRWAVGSVAQKVARHSPVPVLILHEGDTEHEELYADTTRPLRALVALDGSPLAETALVPAAHLVAALAAPTQGALHLAQVVSLPVVRSERDIDVREQVLQEATTYVSTLAGSLGSGLAAELGLKVTWSVAMNEDVADALIRMAELGEETGTYEVEGCDLIAMATHGRGGIQRWMLGSITERVLDGTKLPMLVVRPHQMDEHQEQASEEERTRAAR